jgi:hypothetical protein
MCGGAQPENGCHGDTKLLQSPTASHNNTESTKSPSRMASILYPFEGEKLPILASLDDK